MADYIYTMESRLTPEQMRTVETVQQIARSHSMNVYLTGGAIRDILTGFPIRDLDFAVQGNPLEFQRDIESLGGIVDMVDPNLGVIHAMLQGTQVEIAMARSEVFDKPGSPPAVTPATITEDLRRRDFTFNAMALSLNDGSRGLLLDPFNGAADIEARLIRILHSYAFLEDPSRLIRAIRFATRFGWELEERTRARYDSAREGDYIQFLGKRAIGYEIEQIAYEDDPLAVMRALESEGWLKVLCPKWTVAKAEVPEVPRLLGTRSRMAELNISVNAAPAIMHFLTIKLGDAEIAALQRLIPHKEFLAAWNRLDEGAKELSKQLLSKEAALNSGAWKILSAAKPEALLYLDVTGQNKTVDEKIKNFLGSWRQLQEQMPFAKMAELRITPQLPEYFQICQDAFLLLLDGKLRTESEVLRFLAPYEPPLPPPPPVPIRRGRAAAKKAPVQAAKAAAQSSGGSAVQVAAVEDVNNQEHQKTAAVGKKALSKNHASPAKTVSAEASKKVQSGEKTVGLHKAPAQAVLTRSTVVSKGKAATAKPTARVAATKVAKVAKKAQKPKKLAAKPVKPALKKVAHEKPAKKAIAKKKNLVQKHSKPSNKHAKRH